MTNLFYAHDVEYAEEQEFKSAVATADLFGLTIGESLDLQEEWKRMQLEEESPENTEKLLQFFGA